MKKEFMRILLDSCDKKQLVNGLVEMINDDNQLAWIMGLVPNMDERFVNDHYSDLLAIADRKFNRQKEKDVVKIVGKPFASDHPYDFPYVQYVIRRKVFVSEKAKEEYDIISAKIEYMAENKQLSFDELYELINKCPYYNKKLAESVDYPCQITHYSTTTVYLYSDDIAQIVKE